MNHDEAISILSHRFQSPTQGATEEYVEALHVIIEDVTHSAVMAACAAADKIARESGIDVDEGHLVGFGDCVAEEVRATVDSYVTNHYGEEEFGL